MLLTCPPRSVLLLLVLQGQLALNATPEDDADAAKLVDFFTWLEQRGTEGLRNVHLGSNTDGIRGLYSTRDIDQGTFFMAVPRRALLRDPGIENLADWFSL